MNITRDNIAPFLDVAISEPDNTRVDAWLSAISALLTTRYGADLPAAIAPVVYNVVADAIFRRLQRGSVGEAGGIIKKQGTGPSYVEYDTTRAGLSGWFLPGQAVELDEVFGSGSVSSVRTPAPDAVRYGNRASRDLGGLFGLGIEVNVNESELEDGDDAS